MKRKYILLILCILHICFLLISCEYNPFPAGEKVYKTHCENCHMANGSGLPPMYPSLHNSQYLRAEIGELPCLIKNGRKSQIMKNVYMPSAKMSTIDMSNLIKYLTNKWGLSSGLTQDEIENKLKVCTDGNQ